ncbi:MAG: hypothetical protein OEZ68_02645 [Gammaproteobacteria bacterium]|nr:hypothetical protein [Gammaproteobacteria bacterium]MDH5799679.1 hypothetical protein [Gammaproteobacteria bacterium]
MNDNHRGSTGDTSNHTTHTPINTEDLLTRRAVDPAIREIGKLYKEAEDKIKEIEHIGEGLVVPAINELRYAGHHVLKSLNTRDTHQSTDELGKAKKHCKRAIYDASEAGLLYLFRVYKNFREDYRRLNLQPHFSNYEEKVATVKKAYQLLEQRHAEENKDELYQKFYETYRSLKETIETFENSRDDLNRVIVNERWKFVTIAVSVISVSIAVLALFGFGKPNKYTAYEQCVALTQSNQPNLTHNKVLEKCNSLLPKLP